MSSLFSQSLPRSVQLAHEIVSARVESGDTVVDATVGNGHDTVFLAKRVGPTGKVFGFDVQEEAISGTRERIGSSEVVDLYQMSHALMADVINGPVKAIMFNLGYLPSGDKSLVTSPGSTIPALNAALSLLGEHGIITLVAYSGHEGGEEELEAVHLWCRELDQSEFTATHYSFLNQINHPPELFAIERK